MGWTDWLRSTEAPQPQLQPQVSASPKPEVAPATPSSRWQKLEFTPAVQMQTAISEAPEMKIEEKKPATTEDQALSVGALNKKIRSMIEGSFSLIWVRGEISNFKAHPSGHFYFSLKDSQAQVQAVMFKGFNSQLRFKPSDGLEVIVRGKVTVYEPRGQYQIACETMEPVGAGALQKEFERLKALLQAEGLFANERKRAIPTLPKRIAIVTSPSGAAIRDMLNVLGRRYRAAEIFVVPCAVQGDKAPAEIVKALRLANQLREVDVIIAGRGGGSIEDLWAFNTEIVARAIAVSHVPVISAVGHEIDFTIADFVADLRAPTPSAAAELVAKSAGDTVHLLKTRERQMTLALLSKINRKIEQVRSLTRLLVDPRKQIADSIQNLDELTERMEKAISEHFAKSSDFLEYLFEKLEAGIRGQQQEKFYRMSKAVALLESVSPLKVLARGYSVVSKNGKVIEKADAVSIGDMIDVRLAVGQLRSRVEQIDTTK